MRKIPLTKGMYALVDDKDYKELMKHKWCVTRAGNSFYAVRSSSMKKGPRRLIFMHRQILKPPPGYQCDHKNHNTLDNRNRNLRIATHAQNIRNQPKRKGTWSSRFKGVSYFKRDGTYHASIAFWTGNPAKRRTIHLGTFSSEVAAARAYDDAAMSLFKEFAWLNFRRK